MQNQSYVTKQPALLLKNGQPLLSQLDMELTERCNNNCAHCCINLPAHDQTIKDQELSTVQLKELLKEAVSLGCLKVRFSGGEPLLREDFEELYIFSRKLGLRVLLYTNATLITAHLAELFSRIPPLARIEVSVYGMKKSSYEAVTRTAGSFEAAWKGLNLLLEHKIPFVVKGAYLPPNKEEIGEFETWAATVPSMDKTPAYAMFFDLRCRRDDRQRNDLIRKLRVTPEVGLKVITRNREKYLKNIRELCAKFMGPRGDTLFTCGSGRGDCVDAYGYFQRCLTLKHPDYVYDLKKGSLTDALTNFAPKMKAIKAANPDYLRRCARCFLKGLCEQCPAKSWMEHGTLDTPVEYFCEVAHAQARYVGLIDEHEKAWEVKDWKRRLSCISELA